MAERGKHRKALIWTAARLFRRHGYAGTGLNEILAESGAPRGSLYLYFPGGKEEIGAAAVEAAGRMVTDTLAELAETADSPAGFVRRYMTMLAGWLEASSFRDGCPITTTLLETTPESDLIAAAGRTAFADWRKVIEGLLAGHGWPPDRAEADAAFIVAGLEGALVMARVEQSARPIETAAGALCAFLETPPLSPA